ncbi:MAG: amidohydrolase family protein [Acidobacteriia bacterium]|nr:amidohydrolase family protein [Terriglobia bacterium]
MFALLLFLAFAPLHAATVIRDVTVIDVTSSAARPHQNVVIEGQKIVSIGPAIPAGARVVNGRGKFLIPGLWDMHVHLWYKQNQLPMFVAFGVTGVQDMGSDFQKVSAWRDAIEKGQSIGPHIVTSGPPVDGRASDDEKLPVIAARTPDDARKAFDKLWDMHVDFIKVLSSLSRDSYFALAEQARHWDMRLEGHIPISVTAWDAVEARQASIEHLFGVMKSVSTDSEALRFFEQCAAVGTRISPTLVLWQRMAHIDDHRLKNDASLKYVAPQIRTSWPELKEEDADASKEEVKGIYRLTGLTTQTKVEVLAGTDTGDPWTIPGSTLHDELEQLVAAGFSPHQALRAATLAPAKFLGWEESMGSIEKGKLADLVLLDANPLEDIRNTRKIAAVFVRGRYLSRLRLNQILATNAHD